MEKEELKICLIYLGEHPVICPNCKQLNNRENTHCTECQKNLS